MRIHLDPDPNASFYKTKKSLTDFFANFRVFSYISFEKEETPTKDDENIN